MNCARHSDTPVAAYCRTCGKALCETCKRDVRGVIYCEDCLASRVQAPPAQPGVRPVSGPHPAVAGVLAGFLPFGVGQAYNGQYARGLVYLIAFIGLIWATTQGEGEVVFGLLLGALYFWQLIDAIRSASYLQAGQPAPDPFGVDRLFGGGAVPQSASPTPAAAPTPAPPAVPPAALVPLDNSPYTTPPVPGPYRDRQYPRHQHSNVPLGALALIGIGVLLLLGNIGFVHLRWAWEFWPVILMVIGGWLLAERWTLIAMGGTRSRQLLLGPAILLVLGLIFLSHTLHWLAFGVSWPAILIVIGVVLLWPRGARPLPPLPQATPAREPQARDVRLNQGPDVALNQAPDAALNDGPDVALNRGENKAGLP
jgi:TM2 domain-containing membrane protein YozV